MTADMYQNVTSTKEDLGVMAQLVYFVYLFHPENPKFDIDL